MVVRLLWVTPQAEQSIEYAARLCYDSHDKAKEGSAAKLIKACMNKGHYSITEHACASFEVSDVSRALLAQITRHRFLSFCVRSQRYCKEDGFDYTVPSSDAMSDAAFIAYMGSMRHSQEAYDTMISEGVKPEDARAVLPNACHTTFIVTANFRAWYEFTNKRKDRAAQKEIRSLATKIYELLNEVAPSVFPQETQCIIMMKKGSPSTTKQLSLAFVKERDEAQL